jgi:4-amino-4-deoxy-L-arabinose transferase-like glycosyltransferase
MQNDMTLQNEMSLPGCNLLWRVVMFFSVVCVFFAGLYWIAAHPYSDSWDEAYYVNQACRDYQALKSMDLRLFANTLIFGNRDRPFAYRLIALPFSIAGGPGVISLRVSSFVCFWITVWFVYLIGKRVFKTHTGLVASLIVLLSPEAIASSVRFYTESSLYLALAAFLYFLLRSIQELRPSKLSMLGLGISLGLGFLTKISFIVMVAPALMLLFVFKIRIRPRKQTFLFFLSSLLIGLFIAFPWWFKNYAFAFGHMEAARDFAPFCLAQPGLSRLMLFCFYFIKCVVGFFSLTACLLVIGGGLLNRNSGSAVLTLHQKQFAGICLFCSLPFLIIQLSTLNHAMRLASPAIIPLALLVSVFGIRNLWKHTLQFNLILGTLCLLQSIFILSSIRYKNEPAKTLWDTSVIRALPLEEQWDWNKVYQVIHSRGIANPKIGLVGAARPLKPSNVEYPWIRRQEKVGVGRVIIPENVDFDSSDFSYYFADYNVIITLADYPYNGIERLGKNNALNATLIESLCRRNKNYEIVFISVGRYKETSLAICIKKDSIHSNKD